MPIDKVLERKQEFDQEMLNAFRQLLSTSAASRVQELFQNLIEYTESRIQNQSRATRDAELSDNGQ